jgi:hypothetical protein
MRGINLKYGTNEKSHHPVVVNHMYVCVVAFYGVSEKREEEFINILEHQQSGNDEGNIGKHHYMAKSLQGDVIAIISLGHLH